MSAEDMLKESRRLSRYGARQARRLGIKPKHIDRSSMTIAAANKLRVVFDTNVYSRPSPILSARLMGFGTGRQGHFVLLVSPAILAKSQASSGTICNGPKRNRGSPETRGKNRRDVSPKIGLQVISEDPETTGFGMPAAADRADLIVSGYCHLRRFKSFSKYRHRSSRPTFSSPHSGVMGQRGERNLAPLKRLFLRPSA